MTKIQSAQSAQNANRPKSRIQQKNRQIILDAALDVFSTYGFRGTTIDQIAAQAGMSKPNLIYYFASKEDLYRAVLEDTLDQWLVPLAGLDSDGDPIDEIRRYIAAKVAMSRARPKASRLFANEMLHGAPAIGGFLHGLLKTMVDDKAVVIRQWISDGALAPVDPVHLIFMIWAVTQHYADFDVQVRAVLGPDKTEGDTHFDDAEAAILTVF
ncbi:MAG TPA: TetR family transcriptional regulator C-terminal domain-containing protein, partial [Afifellaceae bacterium]|nr:TetR family transcriptional regulator C-terminal domain-containing protein [Afifellaceae bacterium]